MKRFSLLSVLLLALALLGPIRAAGDVLDRDSDSIFYVDGLLADTLDTEGGKEPQYFRTDLKRYPLVDAKRKPLTAPGMTPMPFSINLPPRGEAMRNLQAADTYALQRDWNRALAEVQRGLEIDPGNMLLLRKGAALAALARKFGVADDYFRRVVEGAPNNVAFVAGRAGVLVRLLRFKEAQALVDRALELDARYLAARFNRACLRIAGGEGPIAGDEWDDSTTEEIVTLANWLDADREDYTRALSEAGYAALCDLVVGPGTRERLRDIAGGIGKAAAAYAAGRWGDCEAALQGVQALGARGMGLQMDVGRCKYEKGEHEAAAAILKELAAKYGQLPIVLFNYAYVLIHTGRYADAALVLEKARAIDPIDTKTAFALACAYAGGGKINQAWPILSELAASNPTTFSEWMEGDEPYLKVIRGDPRYARVGEAPAAP